MINPTTRWRAPAMFAAAALLLTACAGGTTGSGNSDDAVADPNATFSFSLSAGATTLDPFTGVSQRDLRLLWPVYDRLTYINPQGDVEPMLATKWEFAEDGKSFTLHLRDGTKFSDETPVDANSVKQSLEHGMKLGANSDYQQLSAIVDSVETPDAMTVKLNLKRGGAALPFLLGGRVGMIVSPKALDNVDLDRVPVGAGAFTLESSAPGTHYVFDRRDDYWDTEAYKFGKLEWTIQADDSTRLNAVRSGQQQATFVRETQVKEANAGGLEIVGGPQLAYYSINLNAQRSKFKDPRVRQALSLAIDRESISKHLFAGVADATIQPFPQDYWAYSGNVPVDDWGTYDLQRAKQLLSEAGLSGGFTFTAIVSSIPAYQALAQVLKESYAQIGVTMNLSTVDSAQNAVKFAKGDADASVGAYAGDVDPSIWVSTTLLKDGARNPGDLTSPEIEKLAAQAQASIDPKERAIAYGKLLQASFDLGPSDLPINFAGGPMAVRPEVHGLKNYVTTAYDFRDVTVSKR